MCIRDSYQTGQIILNIGNTRSKMFSYKSDEISSFQENNPKEPIITNKIFAKKGHEY